MSEDSPKPLWPALASAACLGVEVVGVPLIGGSTWAVGNSLASPGDLMAVGVIVVVLLVGAGLIGLLGLVGSSAGVILGAVHVRRGRHGWLGGVLVAAHGLFALSLLGALVLGFFAITSA